jgi:hypothetical protein
VHHQTFLAFLYVCGICTLAMNTYVHIHLYKHIHTYIDIKFILTDMGRHKMIVNINGFPCDV